ncbi:MAG TPA: ATP-binding protein [Coriobacteriia bacterium]
MQRPASLPEGASLVPTTDFQKTQMLCAEALEEHGWVVLDGPGGLGKTTAARAFCDKFPERVVRIHLAAKARGNSFLRRLLEELGEPTMGDEEALLMAAAKVLLDRPVLIYVEEADQMNASALRHLRFLYDNDDLTFAVLLVGVNFRRLFDLVPEIDSRVTGRIPFRGIQAKDLVRTMRQYHPILAKLPAEQIKAINREHCRGNWRKWAIMIRRLARYCARKGVETPNDSIIAAALASLRVVPA